MPKNIHVVNLSAPDQIPPETQSEKDEFEQVKEAVEREEEELQPEIIEEPKPKPKRKPAAKKAIEPVVEETQNEIIEEPKPKRKPATKKINVKVEPLIEEKPIEIIEEKKDDLVNCPKCEKQMTKRTLRYNHKTCPGMKIIRDEIPVKKREKPKVVDDQPIYTPEEIIKNGIKKRTQDKLTQKIRLKEEKIKKLSSFIA